MAKIRVEIYFDYFDEKNASEQVLSYTLDEEAVTLECRNGVNAQRISLSAPIHGKKQLEKILLEIRNVHRPINTINVIQVDDSGEEIQLFELKESPSYKPIDVSHGICKNDQTKSFYTEELIFRMSQK